VAVEKLISAKIAKMKLRQDAIWAIFSDSQDISYPQLLAICDEKRVFQHPRDISPTIRSFQRGIMRKPLSL
jgi:hypothetical protein